MEEDIPIDIHTGKLVDWLVSRRHVKKNWPESVQIIRKKINNAIQDMPEHPDIAKLLSGSYINYFHCLQIIDILRETEKESKNIFGWYTSQRMKDWQEIVRLYEADNVYLAEAAQYLVRNINYEIPSLKKQLSKCRQTEEDFAKKIEENRKGSVMAKERYAASCKKIGITGDDIKAELIGLLNNLPEKFSEIAEKVKKLKRMRQFYEDYIHFIVSPKLACLPLLNFIIEHGNTTIYEWKYGEPPISIEKPENELNFFKPDVEDEIVVGIDSNEIDFGADVELQTGEIDWGNVGCSVNKGSLEYLGKEDYELNYDFLNMEVKSSGFEGGVAKGEEALTILYAETTRNEFINELLELEGFLSQRVVELEAKENIVSMNLFSNSPRSLQYQSIETITEYLKILSQILQDLNSTQMQHLYTISSSARYVDRLADSLKRHLLEGERLLSSIEVIKQKQSEVNMQQHQLNKNIQLIVSRTKELQKNIEKHISLKYKNREVNLMGGIQYI